jgi:2,4-dienoyl-CoA reductase-like NADH-dependent reductase (Old Yellow Enzyme family)
MTYTDLPALFRTLEIRACMLKNRIVMSPMCQYCAKTDGLPTSWHHMHWATRAVGGVGLVLSEATAVCQDGRLTANDLGLYNEVQAESFKTGIDLVHAYGAKFGVQIGHCGSKSWGRTKGYSDYRLISASDIAFDKGWKTPEALQIEEIEDLTQRFVRSARLALTAGADVVEIHAGHGYLFHQFLSPISNVRKDDYGGPLENRARFIVDVVRRVRLEIGHAIPLLVRISSTDFAEPQGFVLEDAVHLSRLLRDVDVDIIDCSAGGTLPITNPPLREGYQLQFAERIRKEAGIKTAGVGLLTHADFCNAALEAGECDLVVLGRELLRNPYWALYAAKQLEVADICPQQYVRGF